MNLIQSIQNLFHNWCSIDRIRQSPTRGCLTRLQIGDKVLIRETIFIVINRDTILSENISKIVYKLREPDSPSSEEGKICLNLLGLELNFVACKLEFRGDTIELFEDDPIVL